MPRKLTERQQVLLLDLYAYRDMETTSAGPGWLRPMDLGGSDASHHSGTLSSLVRRGLVDRKERGGWHRPSWIYRIADAGVSRLLHEGWLSRRPGGGADTKGGRDA